MFTDPNLSEDAYQCADYVFVGLRQGDQTVDLPSGIMSRLDLDRVLPQSDADVVRQYGVRHKTKAGLGVMYLVEPKEVAGPGAFYVHGFFYSVPMAASAVWYRVEQTEDRWQTTVVEVLWES
jgi:hypothetical protein